MTDPFSKVNKSVLTEATRIALEASKRGGEVLLSFWQQLQTSQIKEKSAGDLVTAADIAAEEAITCFLQKEMPEAAIVSEEGTVCEGMGPVWYIDPLDGTTNFVQKFPVFAVSLGLAESTDQTNPKILSGVVYNPISGDLFYSSKGHGSFLNETQLHVSSKTKLSDAVIATGFPRKYHEELRPYLREFELIFRSCRAIRRAGAASLDLCWTAQGIFDGFWEHRLSPWDIAAGVLIVQEAGGICTDLEGGTRYISGSGGNVIGAPNAIHAAILEQIQTASAV